LFFNASLCSVDDFQPRLRGRQFCRRKQEQQRQRGDEARPRIEDEEYYRWVLNKNQAGKTV